MGICIFSNVIAGLLGFTDVLLLNFLLFLAIPCRDWHWALRSRVDQPVPLDSQERHVPAVRAARAPARRRQRQQELCPGLPLCRLPGGSSQRPRKQPGNGSGEHCSHYSDCLFLLPLQTPAPSVLLQQCPQLACRATSRLYHRRKAVKRAVCQWD